MENSISTTDNKTSTNSLLALHGSAWSFCSIFALYSWREKPEMALGQVAESKQRAMNLDGSSELVRLLGELESHWPNPENVGPGFEFAWKEAQPKAGDLLKEAKYLKSPIRILRWMRDFELLLHSLARQFSAGAPPEASARRWNHGQQNDDEISDTVPGIMDALDENEALFPIYLDRLSRAFWQTREESF